MALIDGLVGYWKLDEASGTRNDSVGTNHLTDVNSVGSAAGKISLAADFELASSQYFTHADNSDFNRGDTDFTFQAWVNLESKGATGIVLGDDSTASAFGSRYYLYYRLADDRWSWDVYGGVDYGNLGRVVATAAGAPSVATWYHLIAWHDSVNNEIGLAVNAGTPATTAHTLGVNTTDGAGVQSFYVGNDPFAELFDGLIDEVGLWSRVLTSGERTQLYNGGAGLAYPFVTQRTFYLH